jgi:ABC-2 type transport system ATP-binding protein
MPKVVVRDLKKRYGNTEAVRGVSFEIREGEIFGLLGPNGAGKTTTLECLIGLREPDSGQIEVCGIDALKNPREVKQRIGAALQTISLQDKITAREALALFGSFYRLPIAPEKLLERFSLQEKSDQHFDTLSGGQKQRLAIALAFVNNPELIFLDEPTTGLDPQSRRELHQEIAKMKREGHTVLITTHYMEEAEQLCDRLAVVDHGQIIATGTPRELIGRSAGLQTVSGTTSSPVDPSLFAGLPGAQDAHCDDTAFRFRSASANEAVGQLLRLLREKNIELAELHLRKASLEDVFIELTGSRLRD